MHRTKLLFAESCFVCQEHTNKFESILNRHSMSHNFRLLLIKPLSLVFLASVSCSPAPYAIDCSHSAFSKPRVSTLTFLPRLPVLPTPYHPPSLPPPSCLTPPFPSTSITSSPPFRRRSRRCATLPWHGCVLPSLIFMPEPLSILLHSASSGPPEISNCSFLQPIAIHLDISDPFLSLSSLHLATPFASCSPPHYLSVQLARPASLLSHSPVGAILWYRVTSCIPTFHA